MNNNEVKEYKRAIINKLDVTECDFLTADLRCDCADVFMYEKYRYMNKKSPKCSRCSNCYYKQLIQLKAENEDLKEQKQGLKELFQERAVEVSELTQKLEKAIETMDEVKNMINPDRSWECFDEWEEYVYKGMNRLQQALKELGEPEKRDSLNRKEE